MDRVKNRFVLFCDRRYEIHDLAIVNRSDFLRIAILTCVVVLMVLVVLIRRLLVSQFLILGVLWGYLGYHRSKCPLRLLPESTHTDLQSLVRWRVAVDVPSRFSPEGGVSPSPGCH
jgi:hypothetical protein